MHLVGGRKTPMDLLQVRQAEHTPSHLPVGNLKPQSIVSGVWEESEGFGGNPWKHKKKHETPNILFSFA